jgi:thiamine-phosphate pyrophosphorylase
MDTFPSLQAIVDADVAAGAGWRAVDLAEAFLGGGARFLQLRAKRLESGPFLELCDAVVALARAADALVIVNDRVDLARLSGAGGVHLGQDDLPPSAARLQLGDAAVIGVSTHSVSQIEAALIEPASYTAVGPIFGTRTKDTGYEAVGLALVSEAASCSGSRPVVAIGGITLETAPAVRAAGATAIAVIGDLLTGGRPDARVREYLRALA